MSRESQATLRRMVENNPLDTLKRFYQLRALHRPDYSDRVDPFRYQPPFPGIPDYGCVGCEQRLPWHTSFHIKDAQGRPTPVDAHACFGPEPVSSKGKAKATQTFSQLVDRYSA